MIGTTAQDSSGKDRQRGMTGQGSGEMIYCDWINNQLELGQLFYFQRAGQGEGRSRQATEAGLFVQ